MLAGKTSATIKQTQHSKETFPLNFPNVNSIVVICRAILMSVDMCGWVFSPAKAEFDNVFPVFPCLLAPINLLILFIHTFLGLE